MSKRPWIKFYPADWQADQALGACSLAARGLWMEMIAIMHRAEPYGHLVINGHPVTDTQLAALARTSAAQVPDLLAELETAGVFSRGRRNVILSRRMLRDEQRRKDGETSAETGTIPASRRGRQVSVNKQENRPPPGVVMRVVEQPPHHPESRSHKLESKKQERDYAFLGKVIRLLPRDLAQWRKSYRLLGDGIEGYLESRDAWLSEQPESAKNQWFKSTSAWLAKLNAEAAAEERRATAINEAW